MRDSPLKRFLLKAYFSYREVSAGFSGLFHQPPFKLVSPDYEAYWRHRQLMGVEPRFAIISDRIEANSIVLDVGCGDGVMLSHLAETKNARGLGIDISQTAVDKARSRGIEARVERLEDLCRISSPGSFDHVVISEVLEHVVNPEDFVQMGWKLCRRALWLTFPNIAYFRHRLRLFAGKFPVQWVIFPGEHVRFWSIPDFRHWIEALELPEPRVYASNGFIFLGLHRLWPNLLANQIVIHIAKPLPDSPPISREIL